MSSETVLRGEIYWTDWNPARGSEQAGIRPALIVQTDAGNENPRYPNTIVAAISTARGRVPSHVEIEPSAGNGLRALSCVKCQQLVTISKSRLTERIGELSAEDMLRVDGALRQVLGL
jgi:mRNA interferase MazF